VPQPRGGLTTHSTRAEIARMSFAKSNAALNASRRVNSGVMRLRVIVRSYDMLGGNVLTLTCSLGGGNLWLR
jgi:hypothetical protein